MTASAAPRRPHMPALDGLRALAILVVIAHNVTVMEADHTLPEKLWTFFVDSGWIGVQLFFVLSGFLITGILLDSRDRPHPYRTFYTRRALRIFPLYYVFLIGRFLILPLFIPALWLGFGHTQIWYWLYLSNWADLANGGLAGLSHFWSLAVEEQFYLVWPALAGRIADKKFAWTCVAIAVVALAARIAMRASGLPLVWMYTSTIARADGLALGALVALALRTEHGRALLVRWRLPLVVGSLVALAGVMAYAHGLSRFSWVVQTLGYTLLAILFAFLVAECATPDPRGWRRWIAHPTLQRVGRYSYAMYVFHLPLRFAVMHYDSADILAASSAHPLPVDVACIVAVAVGSFVLAAISFVVLERPFLRLKDRWAPA